MLAKVLSCALIGLEGELVEVEVDVTPAQIPSFTIVGLPDTAVQEAKERVRAAIRNSGAKDLPRRVVVNLAPATCARKAPRMTSRSPSACWSPRASSWVTRRGPYSWASCRWRGRCATPTASCQW
jgi:hypothetical protein